MLILFVVRITIDVIEEVGCWVCDPWYYCLSWKHMYHSWQLVDGWMWYCDRLCMCHSYEMGGYAVGVWGIMRGREDDVGSVRGYEWVIQRGGGWFGDGGDQPIPYI